MENNTNEVRHICSLCGDEITSDDVLCMGSDELCEMCYEANVSICDHCGDAVWNDNTVSDEDTILCNLCFDEYYYRCDNCNTIIRDEDARHYRNHVLCETCYDEDIEEDNYDTIKPYDYKPNPSFYGAGPRFFGVELEIDDGGGDSNDAEELLDIGNTTSNHIYIKHDGSLSDGFEIVTHPMTLDYHKQSMPWKSLAQAAVRLGYRSHKTCTCGLHIHVNRDSLGETLEEQEATISRILHFMEYHWSDIIRFSRRQVSALDRWAHRLGYRGDSQQIMQMVKDNDPGRYTCVNLTNWKTIEFRVFRGTLKYNTIIATLEFVDALCTLAMNTEDFEFENISWVDFVERLREETCPELITYLKERKMYLNEEVEYAEDN